MIFLLDTYEKADELAKKKLLIKYGQKCQDEIQIEG